jgi:hypothetical protein
MRFTLTAIEASRMEAVDSVRLQLGRLAKPGPKPASGNALFRPLGAKMKKYPFFLSLIFCAALISGCAKPFAWPSRTARYYAYKFTPVDNNDDAAQNIRDLKDKIVMRANKKGMAFCKNLNLDNDGVNITFRWTDQEEVQADSATTLYSPIASLTANTHSNIMVPVGRERTLSVPFKGIEIADLVGHGNMVHLYYDTDTTIVLGLGNPTSAKIFLDSLLTLAQHEHLRLLPNPGFTLYGPLVRPEVKEALHLEHGLIIGNIRPGGPADLAGLSPGDVILDMNGQAVETVADYADIIKGGGPVSFHVKNFWKEDEKGSLHEGPEKTVTLTPSED